MNKKILIALFFGIIIVIGIIMSKGAKKSEAEILGRDMNVVRVGMNGEKTEFGFVKVHINDVQGSEESVMVNIALDLNNDGFFEEYSTADGQIQPEWIVQNFPVRAIDEQNTFSFFFPDKSAEDNVSAEGIMMSIMATKNSIEGEWDGIAPLDAESKEESVQIAFEDVGDLQSPAPGKDGGFGFLYSDGYSSFANIANAQGAERINIFHAGVPDINQGRNECAPTSAANSLIWLAKKFDFEDKLPSQADLISELKNDMNWADGIAPNDFLVGKEAITARRELPLVNHQLGNFNGTGTFAQMAQELAKDQDVEMRIQYKDATGNATGGHWVTVVGLEQMPNGTQIIDVHDPLSPGPAKLQRYRLDNTANGIQIANYPYGRAYVSFAIAESYEEPEEENGDDSSMVAPEDDSGMVVPGTSGSDTSDGDEPTISISPISLSFTHQIGRTSCPQPIGKVKITDNKNVATKWKIHTPMPLWLQGNTSGDISQDVDLQFSCQLSSYISQMLNTSLEISLTDEDGQRIGTSATLNISGEIINEDQE